MLNAFTKAFRAARQASDWRDQQDKIETACQEAKTVAHFEALLEHFTAREIGSHIADNAEEAAYHPHESTGYAMITLEDGAILTHWNDAGFYHTETIGEEEASKIIEEANAAWHDTSAELKG